MLSNIERKRRILCSILLSLAIVMVAKEIQSEINYSEADEQIYNDEIVYLDNNKMLVDGKIADVKEIPGYTYIGNGRYVEDNSSEQVEETTEIRKASYTAEELKQMIEEGTAIKKQYGNSPFYVYCIEVPNGTNNYFVPSGYTMYEELYGIKYDEGSPIVYEPAGVYHYIRSEKIRARIK